MMFNKISQNFVKYPLKFCLISQILVHSLWHVCISKLTGFLVLFYKEICFMSYLVLFCYCVFSPFSIAITSLEEERANLSVFRTFVDLCLFGFVGFLFLLVSG